MPTVSECSISAEMMRNAIRTKLREGASREAVCWLVCTFAPGGIAHHRTEGKVPRLAVEVIPPGKREAFLASLSQLREDRIEHSGSQRRSVFIEAEIVFAGGRSSMGCQIFDVSETGASVEPAEIALCPTRFLLRPRFGPSKECEVAWRKSDRIGVRYVTTVAE